MKWHCKIRWLQNKGGWGGSLTHTATCDVRAACRAGVEGAGSGGQEKEKVISSRKRELKAHLGNGAELGEPVHRVVLSATGQQGRTLVKSRRRKVPSEKTRDRHQVKRGHPTTATTYLQRVSSIDQLQICNEFVEGLGVFLDCCREQVRCKGGLVLVPHGSLLLPSLAWGHTPRTAKQCARRTPPALIGNWKMPARCKETCSDAL